MEPYIVHLDFIKAFDIESYNGLLLKLNLPVAVCCPFAGNSSRTAGGESWLMGLPVSGSQSCQACHRIVNCVPFSSSFIPAKCLSWWRTDYMPMQMTSHHWQMFASQQTDLLLLPPLTRTWLGFRSGAVTGAWSWILTKPNLSRTKALVEQRL